MAWLAGCQEPVRRPVLSRTPRRRDGFDCLTTTTPVAGRVDLHITAALAEARAPPTPPPPAANSTAAAFSFDSQTTGNGPGRRRRDGYGISGAAVPILGPLCPLLPTASEAPSDRTRYRERSEGPQRPSTQQQVVSLCRASYRVGAQRLALKAALSGPGRAAEPSRRRFRTRPCQIRCTCTLAQSELASSP
ncbi:uncharacterized protein PSFLO_01883 [Pseudozyma flocculosa]|uniref:Uncharacterized protein n=1 Tax=Pseudozyma flocculosa TaxID=84751 RepID=A0A5C3EWH8_9BASI|nr:uncharacterized protein PSFLO_01883 [Pseudozyma flocculosa]